MTKPDMTEILADARAAGFAIHECHGANLIFPQPLGNGYVNQELIKFAQLQRQRERTGEAVPEEWDCCGNFVVGAEYMGQCEMICCGNPEPAGVPPSPPSSRELLEKALDNLESAADFWKQVKASDEDTSSNGAFKDAWTWLQEAALGVVEARALLPQEPKEEGKS